MGGELLTRTQVQERLGVGVSAVRDWCRQGLLEQRPVPPPRKRGLCACGCGQRTPVAPRSDRRRGRVKGKPDLYIRGHNPRRVLVTAASVARLEALRAARAAVAEAFHRVAVLAASGSPEDLLEATTELGRRKAALTLNEAEVAHG